MLSIFRSNQQIANFLYLIYLVILFAFHFIVPISKIPTRPGILTYNIYQIIPWNTLGGDIIAIILLFLQAFFINVMVSNNKLTNEVNLFPGLFYILIACLSPDFIYLSPLVLANGFYLISIYNLFTVYNNQKSASAIFNVGFFISTASLFYFSYIILILLGFLGLNILRAFNTKERLILLTGTITPYLLLGVYFFWFDQLSVFIKYQITDSIAFLPFQLPFEFAFEDYFSFSLLIIILLVVLLAYGNNIARKIRETQKKINILYWMLIIPVISLLFQAEIQLEHLAIIAMPLGILFSFNFSRMAPNWAELFHLFLLAAILFNQYYRIILP